MSASTHHSLNFKEISSLDGCGSITKTDSRNVQLLARWRPPPAKAQATRTFRPLVEKTGLGLRVSSTFAFAFDINGTRSGIFRANYPTVTSIYTRTKLATLASVTPLSLIIPCICNWARESRSLVGTRKNDTEPNDDKTAEQRLDDIP